MIRRTLTVAGLLFKEIFRKKDFYVALFVSVLLMFFASRIQFYNLENIYRYLMDIGLGLSFSFSSILTVALTARQFPSEIQNRTMQVMIAKPLRRIEFILGKFSGSFFAGVLCFLFFYLIFIFFALLKTSELSLPMILQNFYLFCLGLMILTGLSSALSYFLTTAPNVILSLGIYFFISCYGEALSEWSRDYSWLYRQLVMAVYYVVPHFEFFDTRDRLIHGHTPVPITLVIFLTVYALAYTSFFIFISWVKFRKQSI